MTIEIINRRAITEERVREIMRNGTTDTRTYRFIAREYPDRAEIQRLPIRYLDTTAALDGWETVAVVRG